MNRFMVRLMHQRQAGGSPVWLLRVEHGYELYMHRRNPSIY